MGKDQASLGPRLSGVLVAAPFTLVVETLRPCVLRLSPGHLAFCLPGTTSEISQENHSFYSLGKGLRTKQCG